MRDELWDRNTKKMKEIYFVSLLPQSGTLNNSSARYIVMMIIYWRLGIFGPAFLVSMHKYAVCVIAYGGLLHFNCTYWTKK